jgi:hypothetical protein
MCRRAHISTISRRSRTKISIIGVGGLAHFVATQAPSNGKAILVTTTDVTIDHLEFSALQ